MRKEYSVLLFFLLSQCSLTIQGVNLYETIWGNAEQTTQKEQSKKPQEKIEVNLGMNNEEFDAFKKRFHKLLQEQLSKDKYDTLLKEVEGKEIILVLGESGIGKSTFINCLLGHKFHWKYETKMNEPSTNEVQSSTDEVEDLEKLLADTWDLVREKRLKIYQQKEGVPIAAMANNDVDSSTRVPELFTLENGIVLLDCPGFGDSDGKEQEILNLLMIRLCMEKAKRINGVMAFLPYSVLIEGGKGQKMSSLARQLGYLLRFEDDNCLRNIMWCFTRAPEEANKALIVDKLQKLRNKKASSRKSSQRKDMILLEKMLKRNNRILVVNPLWEERKVKMLHTVFTTLGKYEKISINKSHFKFTHPTMDIQSIAWALFSNDYKNTYEEGKKGDPFDLFNNNITEDTKQGNCYWQPILVVPVILMLGGTWFATKRKKKVRIHKRMEKESNRESF